MMWWWAFIGAVLSVLPGFGYGSARPMLLRDVKVATAAVSSCPPVHLHHLRPPRFFHRTRQTHVAQAFPYVDPDRRAAVGAKAAFPRGRPYTICHRGSCGEFPEHTFLSYIGGIAAGGDFIECDVCLTKDLVPVCRHEPLLSNTTNADEVFPELIRTYEIDGVSYTGVFTVDLCFHQLRQLKARQPWPQRNPAWNDYVPIPTLHQYLSYALTADRAVGVYPETKHPTWHDNLPILKEANTTITDIVLQAVKEAGYGGPLNSDAWLQRPIFLQSFEVENLIYARTKTDIPIIQLVDGNPLTPVPDKSGRKFGDLLTPKGLEFVASYGDGVGVDKTSLHDAAMQPTTLTRDAHAAGLQVHLWTLRNDVPYLNLTIEDEFELFFKKQPVDGAFMDQCNDLRRWIDAQTKAGYTWPGLLT